MLNPQVSQSNFIKTLFPSQRPVFRGNVQASLSVRPTSSINKARKNAGADFVPSTSASTSTSEVVITSETAEKSIISVRAVVTAKKSGGCLQNLGINGVLDDIKGFLGKTILLELVSAELDLQSGLLVEKEALKGYARSVREEDEDVKYESDFQIPVGFGEVGAIIVENELRKEIYLKDIVLHGFQNGTVNISCNSYVHSKYDNSQKRVFFTTKSYLPSQTPSGLKRLREEELKVVRGNGEGERKSFERIYDYEVYNDLGDPDSSAELARPILGGKEYPYPRRCRTGRPPAEKDPSAETRDGVFYVPRDEDFSEIKQQTFTAKTVYSVLHALLPILETALIDSNLGFPYFTAIDTLFNEGFNLPPLTAQGFFRSLLPRLINFFTDKIEDVLRFETPKTMDRDKFFWFRDEEFARQTLAGLNPYSIQLVTEWPLKSTLDPTIYGPPESAITAEIIEKQIKGGMTVDEAIKQKKLFILDYHDLLLPYVKKVREIEGTTLYGSRTILFLDPDGTLRPLAIELTRPLADGKPQWKQVFTPSNDSTGYWLWRFAKAHVLAHDSGHHELVSHWLRTHGAAEPFIIASNRQLSEMHPIYRLLHPHFRFTMKINALARQVLISAGGVIETSFSPRKHSMEISAAAYQQWRYDFQALPADLISRGMAVEDPSAPHGIKLTIEDYPFANDGLVLWDAIKEWVTDYVNHYYPNATLIQSDQELQAWWTEIRTVGHGDKKDEPWWPVLKTPQDLIGIITTMIWVTSAHHAAVNFGQYDYAGYFPNRPTIARIKMPTEDPTDEERKIFMERPEDLLMKCFPSQIQAAIVIAVLDVISTHSPDEEYIGGKMESSWRDNQVIKAAFERFNERMKELEKIVDERNGNENLRNRSGAGILPYEFLKPFSGEGVTGKGVPYSISI